jgi:hypothetical protein
MFVKPDKTFDLPKLKEITKVITRNLNKIIEINFYPVPEVRDLFLFKFSYDKVFLIFNWCCLGQTIELSPSSNWHWSSRLGRCFYPDALPIR